MGMSDLQIKKILYATDLSKNARHAFSYAMSLAERYDARIVFLHVVPDTSHLDSHVIGYISEDQWEQIKDRKFDEARAVLIGKQREAGVERAVLDRFCAGAGGIKERLAAVADEIVVKEGNPVEEILRQADERDCDLIVMGSHGTGSLLDAMLGSTARRVIRRSKKPVLVIRLPEE